MEYFSGQSLIHCLEKVSNNSWKEYILLKPLDLFDETPESE